MLNYLSMIRYVARRLIVIPFLLLAISLAVYFMMQLLPGDGRFFLLGGDANTADMGNLNIHADGYFSFLARILNGDFGVSLQGFPVLPLIASRFAPTLSLAILSLLVTILFSFSSVYVSLRYRNRLTRFLIEGFCLFSMSFPAFITGFILLLIFSVGLSLLPVAGYVSFFTSPIGFLRSLLLPSLTLGIMHSGFTIRLMRSSLLRELGRDYIRLARAKGLGEDRILIKEAGANILPELITALSQSLITFLCASAAVEYVFSIPGIGSLVVSSIARRDLAVLEALVLLSALLVAVINLAADLLYAFFDRRVVLDE